MSIRRPAALVAAVTLLLSGCTSYRGADRLNDRLAFDSKEFTEVSRKESRKATAARSLGVRQFFLADLKRAWNARLTGGEEASKANRLLAISGVSLIQINCNEYFNEMGRNQRNSAILRDLITPITAAINTAISLHLFSNGEDTNQNIQLGFGAFSAAGNSALDIYDRRFLFDSDNIASVRSNTMTALSKNADETLDKIPGDFVQVVARLQQIENYCTPAEILNNVRASLKAAQFANQASSEEGKKPGENGADPGDDGGKDVDADASDAAFIETTPMK